MDYETADGSQFSLQEVHRRGDGEPMFDYTSVTALVHGEAYAGKLQQRMDEVDEVDAMSCLQPVPPQNINPLFPRNFTRAPPLRSLDHYYLKGPTFTYEDTLPGQTFIADCLFNEAAALEKLSQHPHPNIAKYYGCIVKDGRITQLCLERYPSSLADIDPELARSQDDTIIDGVVSAVKHLHSLGLAHNDVCPQNVCLDQNGSPILVDFDSCLPFGDRLMKGTAGSGDPISSIQNDLDGLERLEDFLNYLTR